MREYLNDFEEFCGAIRAGVVNENYARELEGDRTINAYFAFVEFINLIRNEAEESGRREIDKSDGTDETKQLREYRRKPYQELRSIAVSWRKRREKEFAKLAQKRQNLKESLEEHEHEDGVGKST